MFDEVAIAIAEMEGIFQEMRGSQGSSVQEYIELENSASIVQTGRKSWADVKAKVPTFAYFRLGARLGHKSL